MNDLTQFIRTLNAVRTKMGEEIFTRRFGWRIHVRVDTDFGGLTVGLEKYNTPIFLNFGQFKVNFIP